MVEPQNCPVCEAKAYIHKDVADGYFFGWSAGCPRYCVKDGIHGIDSHERETKGFAVHNCTTKEEAIGKWNERCEEWLIRKKD